MSSKTLVLILFLACLLVSAPAVADNTVYDNGPVNGTVDAWTINFGYAVTDSFTLDQNYTVTGFQFGVWAYPGDTPLSVDYAIDTSPFGSSLASGTVALQSTFLYSNQYGYDIDWETASGLSIPLSAGNYWLTLQNAVTTQGEPLYWDENSGPSQAQESSLGTIPSESFLVTAQGITCGTGGASPACQPPTPEPGTFVLFGSGLLGLGEILRRKGRL